MLCKLSIIHIIVILKGGGTTALGHCFLKHEPPILLFQIEQNRVSRMMIQPLGTMGKYTLSPKSSTPPPFTVKGIHKCIFSYLRVQIVQIIYIMFYFFRCPPVSRLWRSTCWGGSSRCGSVLTWRGIQGKRRM